MKGSSDFNGEKRVARDASLIALDALAPQEDAEVTTEVRGTRR